MKSEQTAKALFKLMLGIPTLALRDHHGYGKVRLERFVDQVLEIYEDYQAGRITMGDIEQTLEKEVGIRFEEDK